MQVHTLIRPRSVVAFLGIALGAGVGAALAYSPTAVADPIVTDWPYDGTTLPGYVDPTSVTNFNDYSLGPLGNISTEDYNVDLSDGGAPWYSVSDVYSDSQYLFNNDYDQVTNVLDDAPGYPSVGTVADSFQGIILSSPAIQGVPLLQNYYLDDPKLGLEDGFSPFPGVENTYLSDSAGIEDIVNAYGHSYTLFDLPASAASGADLGDGFQQLMTEFTTLF
jgi:hypothetical protein